MSFSEPKDKYFEIETDITVVMPLKIVYNSYRIMPFGESTFSWQIRVEDSQISLVVIKVPRADYKIRPVFVGENPYKGTFKRNHEGDYHASAHEVDSMIRDKNPDGNDGIHLMISHFLKSLEDTEKIVEREKKV